MQNFLKGYFIPVLTKQPQSCYLYDDNPSTLFSLEVHCSKLSTLIGNLMSSTCPQCIQLLPISVANSNLIHLCHHPQSRDSPCVNHRAARCMCGKWTLLTVLSTVALISHDKQETEILYVTLHKDDFCSLTLAQLPEEPLQMLLP